MKLLKLGIVGRAHGLRGSFFVSGRDEAVPPTVKTILIGPDPTSAVSFKVTQRFWQNGRAALQCEGVSDRNSAEALTGKGVWCDAAQISIDDTQEFLLSDLEGRTVVGNDGIVLGIVEQAYPSPSGAVNLVVLDASKNADVEIPVVDYYVDMGFVRGEKELKLCVAADTFAEIWNERSKKS